ncbi:MAG: DUF4034 domain-containing protein [Planctomycetes bacterium]|nr:DUF4034 domain-containing protein [Planctomycetota bacterium]
MRPPLGIRMLTRLRLPLLAAVCALAGVVALTPPRPGLAAPPADADDAQDPAALLAAGKFAELDQLADRLWQTKAKDDEGEWVLPRFYDALNAPADEGSAEAWEAHLKRIEGWIADAPGSATARAVHGAALTGYAWDARGGGWAGSVTAEGWKLFHERLHAAREVLEIGLKLPNPVPGLYSALLTVGMGQSWKPDAHDRIFRAAVAFEPTDWDFYYRRAQYLHKRWFGAYGEWEQFALASGESLRATHGLALYAMIVKQMSGLHGDRLFADNALSWPHLDEGFRDLKKLVPGSLWNANFHAWCAWVMQDRASAARIGPPPGGRYYGAVWGDESAPAAFEAWLKRADTDADVRARLDAFPCRLAPGPTSLGAALAALGRAADLTLVLDAALRRGAGASDPTARPIDRKFENVPVGWALDELVREGGLAYGIAGGSVYVTTPERLPAIPQGNPWCATSAADSTSKRDLVAKLEQAKPFRRDFSRTPVAQVLPLVKEACGVDLTLDGGDPAREIDLCVAGRPLPDLLSLLAFQMGAEPELREGGVLLRALKADAPAAGTVENETVAVRAWLRMIERAEAAIQGKLVGTGKEYALSADLFATGLPGLDAAVAALPEKQRKAFRRDPGMLAVIRLAYYDLACSLAVCSAGKRSPKGAAQELPEAESTALRDRAFDALFTALEQGWSLQHTLKDHDLDPLHADPRWNEVVAGGRGK